LCFYRSVQNSGRGSARLWCFHSTGFPLRTSTDASSPRNGVVRGSVSLWYARTTFGEAKKNRPDVAGVAAEATSFPAATGCWLLVAMPHRQKAPRPSNEQRKRRFSSERH